jgi:carbon-monoxide dehydrogenase large subunit
MIGASPRRNEDRALLTGRGRFLDDLTRPGLLHLGVVRSPHGHARIAAISTAEAAALPGVVAVATAADLPEMKAAIPPYRVPPKFRAFEQPVLARAIVRYVGEPVAVVVADDPRRLADALAAVRVEYEPLAAVASVEAALAGGARVHEAWPDNVLGTSRGVVGDVDAALATADIVVTERFRHGRSAGMPLEPRGVMAWQDDDGDLVVASSTQVTYHVREAVAAVLGLAEERVRVIAPDVGGGFGAKAQVHHEEMLVPAMARRLGRPIKWVEGRHEHFVATCHDREQTHDISVGFRHDGTIVAVDDLFRADFGAYPVQEDAVTLNTVNHLCSPYRVAHFRSVCDNVVTNKMFAAAYRGAGRPEAAFVMDRTLDIAARRLGLDPADIRRRNFVRPSEMPYRPGLTYKDGVPITYDPGDMPADFETLLGMLGYEEFRKAQAGQARGTRRLGVGLSCYLHGSALGPYEGANVRVDPGGTVYVFVGCSSQGQGHATTLAQICAAELGVRFEDVRIVGADTQVLPYGVGAMASRILANAGPAVARSSREVRRKAQLVAAAMLECAPDDVRIVDGSLHVAGFPDRRVTLAEVSRSAVRARILARAGDPGLNSCTYFSPETVTWAFGAQGAIVEVDTETGAIGIVKYAAIHDAGRAVNPMIVQGQLHGAIAQGLGGALMEELRYDEAGQLLTASFMDYGIPKAAQLPAFLAANVDHPSMINDLGVKGVGESGAICPGAVIGNAVADALSDHDVNVREIPVTPARVFELLRAARSLG